MNTLGSGVSIRPPDQGDAGRASAAAAAKIAADQRIQAAAAMATAAQQAVAAAKGAVSAADSAFQSSQAISQAGLNIIV